VKSLGHGLGEVQDATEKAMILITVFIGRVGRVELKVSVGDQRIGWPGYRFMVVMQRPAGHVDEDVNRQGGDGDQGTTREQFHGVASRRRVNSTFMSEKYYQVIRSLVAYCAAVKRRANIREAKEHFYRSRLSTRHTP
jgi:hypothetical protein